MRTAVIMQPTYFPWAGYFNLISNSDVFVFYDDVQFSTSSWQVRNRVLQNDGKIKWITIRVYKKNESKMIKDIFIDDHSLWRKKQFKLLEQNYSRHPFGKEMLSIASVILDGILKNLADMNIFLILSICSKLNIKKPEFLRSSRIEGVSGGRSIRLLEICRKFGCDRYLSPVGSRDYLMEDGAFDGSDVSLNFQEYKPGIYPQKNSKEFISHLSILDVIANIGTEKTAEYIKTGEHHGIC